MKTLLFLLLSLSAYSQSTVTLSTSHVLNNPTEILLPSNEKINTLKESKSSRIQATITITADVELHLLKFLVKDVKIQVIEVDYGVYQMTLHIPTLPKLIKGKEVILDYKLDLVLPQTKSVLVANK